MNKPFRLVVAALVMLVAGASAAHAEYLTVNDGIGTSNFVPINSPDYSTPGTRSQVIYPAEELTDMVGLPINGITFYINSDCNQMNGGLLRLSVGETTRTAYESATGYISGLTEVGTVTMTRGESNVVIDFDTPYLYNGGNLVIDCYVLEEGEFGWTYFLGEVQSTSTAISRGDLRQFLPKATFDYGEAPEYGAKVKHDVVTFDDVRVGDRDEKVVYLKNIGLNAFSPVVTVAAPFAAAQPQVTVEPGMTIEIPVAFEPTVAGLAQGTLNIDCGQAGVIQVALEGTALESGVEYTVCDGDATNQYVPFNGIYADDTNTLGQMIYPASKLQDMKDGKIVAMTFYTKSAINLRNVVVELSLMNTDQAAFDTPTPITGLTAVANTEVIRGETAISLEFDEPFEYDGSNLAVEMKVTTAGWTSTTVFLGEATEDNASLTCYKSWSGQQNVCQQFLPKVTFTYQKGGQQPVSIMGDVNGDQIVDVQDVTSLIGAVVSGDFSGIDMLAANCSGDDEGAVDIEDVTVLITMVLNGN